MSTGKLTLYLTSHLWKEGQRAEKDRGEEENEERGEDEWTKGKVGRRNMGK